MAAKKLKVSKKFLLIALLLVTIIFCLSAFYQKTSQPVTTQPSPSPAITKINIDGIYKGDLPCADCPGITETLIIAKDGSYILEDVYQEKSQKPLQVQGKWLQTNNILKLSPEDGSQTNYFQIEDSGDLTMLDSNMNKINSPFNQTLTKQY